MPESDPTLGGLLDTETVTPKGPSRDLLVVLVSLAVIMGIGILFAAFWVLSSPVLYLFGMFGLLQFHYNAV